MPTNVLKHRYEFYKFLEIYLTSFGVINQKIGIKEIKSEKENTSRRHAGVSRSSPTSVRIWRRRSNRIGVDFLSVSCGICCHRCVHINPRTRRRFSLLNPSSERPQAATVARRRSSKPPPFSSVSRRGKSSPSPRPRLSATPRPCAPSDPFLAPVLQPKWRREHDPKVTGV